MPDKDYQKKLERERLRYYTKRRKKREDYYKNELIKPFIVPDEFGYWFSGFADGEASFIIRPNGKRWVSTRFILGLRADDVMVLKYIQSQLGFGILSYHLRTRNESRNTKPQYRLTIDKKGDCYKLVKLFDRYPLKTKKAKDYAIWKEAILKRGITRFHNVYNIEEILSLAKRLKRIRQFKEVKNYAGI